MNSLISKRSKIPTTEKVCKNLKGQEFVEFCKESLAGNVKILQANHSQAGNFYLLKFANNYYR